jgi:hypothetical protein
MINYNIMMPRNLLEIFHENKELEAGTLVGSTLIKKTEIYGFIPCNDADMDSNSYFLLSMIPAVVAADRIAFPIVKKQFESAEKYAIVPVYRKIRYSSDVHKLLLKKLYVYSLLNNDNYKRLRNNRNPVLSKLEASCSQVSVDKDINQVYYITNPNEILMYKKIHYSRDCVSAIAHSFLVICRFINSVTGEISYAIYPPEDLFPLSK